MLDLIDIFWYTATEIQKEDEKMYDIKVNFPTNKEEYKNGNGEGCWVLVDDDTFAEYDKDSTKKNCVGILHNNSLEYPRFTVGTKVYFELRGSQRPVAIYDFLNDPTIELEKIELE